MFTKKGSKSEVIAAFEETYGLTTPDAAKLFTYLQNHPEILTQEDCFEIQDLKEHSMLKGLYLMIPHTNFYVNLKVVTIVLAALICDISFANGLASAGVGILGINTKSISKLEGARLCLVKEIISQKRVSSTDILSRNRGECVNNDISCKYNQSGHCSISYERINEYLCELEEMNVVKKEGGIYHYQL